MWVAFKVEFHPQCRLRPAYAVTRGLTVLHPPRPELLVIGPPTVAHRARLLGRHVEAGVWNVYVDAELAVRRRRNTLHVRATPVDTDVVAASVWTAELLVWWRQVQHRSGLPEVFQAVFATPDSDGCPVWPVDRDDPCQPLLGDIWWTL